MSDAPKMGFLAALQKGKQVNEQEAKAQEAKPNPVSESRPNPLLSALGKATQKVDSQVVSPSILGKAAASPQKASDSGTAEAVVNDGKSPAVETNEKPAAVVASGKGSESVAQSGGIFAKPSTGGTSGDGSGNATGTGNGLVTSPTNRILAAAAAAKKAEPQANYDHLFDQIPEKFEDVLKKFDELMIRDQGVNDLNVGHLRDYVKRIFVDLKENPEYDGLIVDRDVHNVIKFMRAVKGQAQELAVDKKAKAAKKEASSAKKNRFAAIAGNLDIGGQMPKTIQDMSQLDDLTLELGDLE